MILQILENVKLLKDKDSDWKQFFSYEGLEGMKEFYASAETFEQVSSYIRFHDIVHELLDEDGFEPPILENFEEKNASVGDIVLVHDAYNENAHGLFFECVYSDEFSILVLDIHNDIIDIPHGSYYTSIPVSELFRIEFEKMKAISRQNQIERWKKKGLSFSDIVFYETVLKDIEDGKATVQKLVDRFSFEHEHFYNLGKKRIEDEGLSFFEKLYANAIEKKSL